MTDKEYYAMTGRAARKAIVRKVARGEYPGCAPVGYLNAVIGGKRVIVPDPVKAPLVREAFALRRRGANLRAVLAELGPRGLLSRNGKPMGVSALRLMLANPVYRGWVRYGGGLVHGRHVPILVSPEPLTSKYETRDDPRYITLT